MAIEKISERTIQRLILYRKVLTGMKEEGIKNIYSHQLAEVAASSSAQVRRDLMVVGYQGTPVHGYMIPELIESISQFLNPPKKQNVCLVGIGNLGRAILDYSRNRNSNLDIVAAFDINKTKINTIIEGCRCHDVKDIEKVVRDKKCEVAIITIPPENVQQVAEKLVKAGVKGILNYSPANLKLPAKVFVENRDMMLALEKVCFYASKGGKF